MRYVLKRDGATYVEVPTLNALASAACRLGRDYARTGKVSPELEVSVTANRKWRRKNGKTFCPACGAEFHFWLSYWNGCPVCLERVEGVERGK